MFHQCEGLSMQTASDYLEQNQPKVAISLPESTWGQGGHYWVWQNHNTEWMWPLIHAAEHRMKELVQEYEHDTDPVRERLLNQIFRELLLLQSSDWPFLVTTFQAKDYAIERFTGHQENFWKLVRMLETNRIDEAALQALESKDNPFPNIDYRWYHYEPIAEMQTTVAI
jgi:1,4-alpha-glucan branching enzyme